MTKSMDVESTLTDRYQTTVPETVRRALRLGKRDKLRYSIQPGGEVLLTRAQAAADDDPVIERLLGFLAKDMSRNPERLRVMDTTLADRLKSLVAGVDIDLDAPLSAIDE